MVEEPMHHWLGVVPSVSPENTPKARPNNGDSRFDFGVTMDNEIIFQLLADTARAAATRGEERLLKIGVDAGRGGGPRGMEQVCGTNFVVDRAAENETRDAVGRA